MIPGAHPVRTRCVPGAHPECLCGSVTLPDKRQRPFARPIGTTPMETLIQDLRFALRSLRRTPTFPLAAIGTLALGIAATTAIFSTVNAAVLRPLPYPAA